jgi:hypothetical protein
MRAAFVVVLLLGLGCVRARERQAEEHLRTELNFLVPYVDIESEEKAVVNVLAQRKLVVDERLRGNGFLALSASTFDQKRTAVRIITNRGVVAAEDGDRDELFGASKVSLLSISVGGPGSELLLGIAKTEREHDLGCAQFFRVRPDGNLLKLDVKLGRFGSRACLAALKRDAAGTLIASVGWPSLSAGVAPTLAVDMHIDSGRLDQAESEISVRVGTDEGRFVAREKARLQADLARAVTFPERQAGAVASAALALVENHGVDLQLSAYMSSLDNAAASQAYAELIALTREHIEHGWDDLVEEASAVPEDARTNGDEPAFTPADVYDSVVIDPSVAP